MRTHLRAQRAVEAMHGSTKHRAKGSSRTRGNRRLVITDEPQVVRDARQLPIGIEFYCRLYQDGVEQPIDRHRVVINPPLASVVEPAPRNEAGLAVGPPVLDEDPVGALWEVLWDQVETAPNAGGHSEGPGGTVTTIFANTADADIKSDGATYAIANAGSGALVVPVNSANELWMGQLLFGTYSCYQSMLDFNLSTVAAGQTVTSAIMQTYLVTDASTTADFYCIAQVYDWGASVTTADWQSSSELQDLGAWWTYLHTSGIGGAGAYKSWADTPDFRSLCTLLAGGDLNLVLTTEFEWAGLDTAGTCYMTFANTAVVGTTQDPKLTLTHNRIAVDHTMSGGLLIGGSAGIVTKPLIAATGAGGLKLGGSADVVFHSGGSTTSDLVVEWQFDGETYTDITSEVRSFETRQGREQPSTMEHAGAGTLKLTLRNDSDNFSTTNAASPYNTAPNTLKAGRKIRVRTAESVPADPVLLVRDRFNRDPAAALGTAETGQTWTIRQGGFVVAGQVAAAADIPDTHLIETCNAGQGACYVQCTLRQLPTINRRIGMVAKYTDLNNYLYIYQDSNPAFGLRIVSVIAGVQANVGFYPIQPWEGMTIGMLVTATQAAGYIGGVNVIPLANHGAVGAGTEVGLYSYFTQTSGREPEIDDFHCWDTVAAEVDGILWTGLVDDVKPTVTPGPKKEATVTALGVLTNLSRPKVAPPRLPRAGAPTGLLIGDVLSRASALHPPAPLDAGAVTTGCVALGDAKALDMARLFETVERGTLYETNEGQVSFADSARRATETVAAEFTDVPGAQLGYHALPLLEEQASIVNQVTANIAPDPPSAPTYTIRQGGHATAVDVLMPTVTAGDLVIVAIANSVDAGVEWLTPIWWTSHRDLKAAYGMRIYSHQCDGTEGGTTINFYDYPGVPAGLWVAYIIRITDWFGATEGIAMSTPVPGIESGAVLHGWGREPTLFIAIQAGVQATVLSANDANADPPDGYYGQQATRSSSGVVQYDVGVAVSYKIDGTEVESPSSWARLSGFTTLETMVIAVRGYNGPHTKATLDNPRTTGGDGRAETVEDIDSQDEHNALITHETARLFADETDALAYGLLTIAEFADDRTTLRLSFYATKSVQYRAQAIARRLGHKIRVVADNNSGYGLTGDYFIESISHLVSNGTRLWECTWELSPA